MLVCSESADTAFSGQDTARLYRFIFKAQQQEGSYSNVV